MSLNSLRAKRIEPDEKRDSLSFTASSTAAKKAVRELNHEASPSGSRKSAMFPTAAYPFLANSRTKRNVFTKTAIHTIVLTTQRTLIDK